MNITRTSQLSGLTRTLDIPTTAEAIEGWSTGMHAQDAFPNLTPDQREFIMTGITKEEWDDLFGRQDDNL